MKNEIQAIKFEEYHTQIKEMFMIRYGYPLSSQIGNFPYIWGIDAEDFQWECEKRGWEDLDNLTYNDRQEKLIILAKDKINVGATLDLEKLMRGYNELMIENKDLQDENFSLKSELMTTGKRVLIASQA